LLDIPADGCIVIEDTDVGVAAGRAAGMRTVGVRGTTGDLPVHSISELHRWLHASN
jgi:sugar-phosphatase